MAGSGSFSVIMCCYQRLTLLKEAVEALRRQTYHNLEIILINNGATGEVVEYLHQVASEDERIKLLHFAENQSTPNDPAMFVEVCGNGALEIATGDYIWWQSDDDLIADDYAEKMVALFEGNPDCTTAAGLPFSIDINGTVNNTEPRDSNFRPRYMPGHLLALDFARGGGIMYRTPGTIFTIRRNALVQAGGIRQPLEYMHLYGIVPFGVTGFDETAFAYWRHHEGQLNREATSRGLIGAIETYAFLKDWQIERRWQVFGREIASELVASIERDQCDRGAKWITRYLYSGQLGAALRLTRTMWSHPQFWTMASAKSARRMFSIRPIRLVIRPIIRRGFQVIPGLASLSPRLSKLRDAVKR